MDYIFTPFDRYKKPEVLGDIPDDDWTYQLQEKIRCVRMYVHALNKPCLVVCNTTSQLLYCSNEIIGILGYSLDEVNEKGGFFFSEILHAKDSDFIDEVSLRIKPLLHKYNDKNNFLHYYIRFFLRFKHKDSSIIGVDCTIYPLLYTQGKTLFSVITLKEKQHHDIYACEVDFFKAKHRYIYSLKDQSFIPEYKLLLKSIEYTILLMVANGEREHTISRKLSIDFNTVKYHKKNIMFKLSVHSMPEAVYQALIKGIL
ncbi:MAG: LuxR C-terminal-related transcriptional regulator [Tannerellaceae bacterium]